MKMEMKQMIKLGMVAMACCYLSGCGEDDGYKKVAKEFAEIWDEGQAKAEVAIAEKYEVSEILIEFSEKVKNMGIVTSANEWDWQKAGLAKRSKDDTYLYLEGLRRENLAAVKYTRKNAEGTSVVLKLMKVDGKWKVTATSREREVGNRPLSEMF